MLEKEKFCGCSGFKEGCKFSLPKTYMGKNLTAGQIRKLLKSIPMCDLVGEDVQIRLYEEIKAKFD